jgi:hypothetical protein
MLGILIAPFLVVENGLAAGVVADEPCLTCPLEASVAANAAWYRGMPSLAAYYAAKTEANLAADKDSATANAAWYTGMPSLAAYYAARNDASVAAYAARYSGLARALSAETNSALHFKWYNVDDPSKIPANTARGQNAEASSALDYFEIPANWYDSVSSPTRAQNAEMSSALDID